MVKVELKRKNRFRSPLVIWGSPIALVVGWAVLSTIQSNNDLPVGTLLTTLDSLPSQKEPAVTIDHSHITTTIASAAATTTTTANQEKQQVVQVGSFVPYGTLGGAEPVDCNDYFRRGYRQVGEAKAADSSLNPNQDKIQARFTKDIDTVPHPFWIAVHNQDYDAAVMSSIFTLGQYNQTALTRAIVESLTPYSSEGSAHVLDVGAQVGWVALLARSMGMHVDVFEPLPSNIFRMCESLVLNKWTTSSIHAEKSRNNDDENKEMSSQIHLHELAISDTPSTMEMTRRGASAIVEGGDDDKIKTTVISLDGFIQGRQWTNKVIAVLKVNVEGMEANVIRGANQLLKSKMVKNILIPLAGNDNGGGKEMLSLIIGAGYKLHKWGTFTGPDQPAGGLPTDANQLFTALKAKGPFVNMWFTLE